MIVTTKINDKCNSDGNDDAVDFECLSTRRKNEKENEKLFRKTLLSIFLFIHLPEDFELI